MRPSNWSPLRIGELVLALLVVLVVGALATNASWYPSWPTVGGIPINLELVVPGLFGVVALVRTLRDGFSIGSVVVGAFSLITILLAAMSLQTLYSEASAGAFAGGMFTLVAGVALVFVVVVRNVASEFKRRDLLARVGN